MNKKRQVLFANLALASLMSALPLMGYASQVQDVTPGTSEVASPQQQSGVSGTVVDAGTGEPLIGVSIVVKGNSHKGTVTDINGNFNLDVPTGTQLVFSYVGYQSQALNASKGMSVKLNEDRNNLEDVVVVGYGTMKKRDLTGSIYSLKNSTITSVMSANPLEALQGKSTGVAVFTNNQPGAEPTIRIRGSASINAGTDPLIVVDGFPLVDGNMNDINPADIETMEILKDASSTAIYGSRGANGVIMITTKKGTEGRSNVSVHANMGVTMPGRLIDLIDGEDFANYITEAYTNAGSSEPDLSGLSKYNTDWQKETLESSALTQDYGVTLDGNTGKINYMLSGGYYNQDALIKRRGYEKFSIHTNLDFKINHWLTVGSSMQVSISTQNKLRDQILNDIFRYGWPSEPVYNEDGSYNIVEIGEYFNSVCSNNAETDRRKQHRFLGNWYAQAQITKHLSYKLNIGFDTKTSNEYYFLSSQNPKSIAAGLTTSNGSHNWYRTRSKLMDNILTYQNQWGDHRMTATAVYSWQDYKYNSTGISGQFTNDKLEAFDFSNAVQASLSPSSDYYSSRLISYTGRATYAYKDRYLMTATIRFDGSSRFGSDSKWGTFPSFGLAWIATEEPWLKESKVVTNLKLRGSYGVTGNQEIGNYNSLAKLSSGNSGNYSDGTSTLVGYYESVGNSNLKWERTKQLDLGFDLALFNRAFITLDYYNRTTTDLLYNVPIPSTSGYSNVMSNVGKVNNHGLEVSINGDIVRNKDWKVNVGFNFTTNSNKIKALYGDVESVTLNSGTTGLARILRVGDPVNGVYARHSLGIIKDQATLDWYKEYVPNTASVLSLGDEMYEDVDGDGSITINDYKCIGSIEPRYFYGVNLSVSYKKFSLKAYGQGAWKYASMAGAENSATSGTKWFVGYQDCGSYALWAENNVRNVLGIPSSYAYERMWSESNPDGEFPRPGAKEVYQSDRTNGDWNYFIVKNIVLSYDFSSLLKNLKTVRSLVFNINFQNFITAANHRGYNPENGDVSNPWGKTIMFGINMKF
jgi:TonB-linked SusC/RagA family outer membrane protein